MPREVVQAGETPVEVDRDGWTTNWASGPIGPVLIDSKTMEVQRKTADGKPYVEVIHVVPITDVPDPHPGRTGSTGPRIPR